MANVLVLFAHPLLEKSRIHSTLLKAAKSVQNVTVNDLYERYPDFDIDVEREKNLLLAHSIIIWQYPLYWYSCPPLLKQWLELVLEHGWAYGKKGTALTGKKVFVVTSTGGSADAYQPGGYNKYSIHEYLRPMERSAELCHMDYWPPFWVNSSHRMETAQIGQYAEQYKNMLLALTNDIFSDEEISSQRLMNQLFPIASTNV